MNSDEFVEIEEVGANGVSPNSLAAPHHGHAALGPIRRRDAAAFGETQATEGEEHSLQLVRALYNLDGGTYVLQPGQVVPVWNINVPVWNIISGRGWETASVAVKAVQAVVKPLPELAGWACATAAGDTVALPALSETFRAAPPVTLAGSRIVALATGVQPLGLALPKAVTYFGAGVRTVNEVITASALNAVLTGADIRSTPLHLPRFYAEATRPNAHVVRVLDIVNKRQLEVVELPMLRVLVGLAASADSESSHDWPSRVAAALRSVGARRVFLGSPLDEGTTGNVTLPVPVHAHRDTAVILPMGAVGCWSHPSEAEESEMW